MGSCAESVVRRGRERPPKDSQCIKSGRPRTPCGLHGALLLSPPMRTRLMLPAALPVMAQQFSSLEERMSAADFKAAGLDKLTPQELQSLDNWLRTHEQTKMVSASGQPVFYPENQPRDKFDTHLVGHFNGWAGQTTFTLDNGQVWKQAESGTYSCPDVDNPEVTIKPMILGSWLMYVQGCNQSLRVERVKYHPPIPHP